MKKIILIFLLFSLNSLFAQDLLLQGWYWDYPKTIDGNNWSDTLKNKAQELADAGFTYVWLPPLSRASFGNGSNGYDPKDLYDLGEVYGGGATGFGARDNVDNLIDDFEAVGINAVADVVYNHRDGGKAEDNPAVKEYITSFDGTKANDGYNPFPYDRWRCYIVLGGISELGEGDYYFKVSSASAHSRFDNYEYNFYAQTNTIGWQNLADEMESEPNGGGDCGQSNNTIQLGRNMNAINEEFSGCRTDEFHLTLSATDFDQSGDTLFIYFDKRNSGYSDMRIYGIWFQPLGQTNGFEIADSLHYQTYTDFGNMPSGRGDMDWQNFKPNFTNSTKLDGFWDWPWFFYDYDQSIQSTKDSLFVWTRWLIENVGINGLRMDAVKHFPPQFVSELFDYLTINNIEVPFTVGEFYDSEVSQLNNWINDVTSGMSTSSITPRLFDFALRDALKNASDSFGYDVRNVFNSGMVNGAGMSGFNAVTFLNNHDTRDSGHVVVNDPILGYAYILTNNQIGLPTVFYPDYYSCSDYKPFPTYDLPGLKSEIDDLWNIQKKYITGSTNIDYLSRFSTPYSQNFISGFSNTTLLYQIMETATGRDLLVAINYAGGTDTLDVIHGLNLTNTSNGKVFIDLIGNAIESFGFVESDKLNIKLPPRSYSVWIEGVTVQVKVFLEGAYNSTNNQMSTDLNSANLLPLTSPYEEDPKTVMALNENIVDWILIELYEDLESEPIISKSVFVKNDGMLSLADGSTRIPLDASSGNYYIVLKHRNHLAVSSSQPILISSDTPLFDFTTVAE